MKLLQKWLRDADPIALEPAVDASDLQQMRARVVAAAEAHTASGRAREISWRPIAALGCCVVAAIVLARQHRDGAPAPAARSPAQLAVDSVRVPREIHFATPGGTRVIWLFDPEFEETP
jgi:hypothetical protein